MRNPPEHHIYSWIALTGLLLLLVYALRAIKREKWSYEQTGLTLAFGPLCFFIPGWWSEKRISSSKIEFSRVDTNYDWQASFEWHTGTRVQVEQILKDAGITYDEELVRTENDLDFFKDLNFRKSIHQCVRLEGRATQNQEERIYLDFFILDFKDSQLVAWNQSSVLTGVVEGPYFEEVMLRLKFTD